MYKLLIFMSNMVFLEHFDFCQNRMLCLSFKSQSQFRAGSSWNLFNHTCHTCSEFDLCDHIRLCPAKHFIFCWNVTSQFKKKKNLGSFLTLLNVTQLQLYAQFTTGFYFHTLMKSVINTYFIPRKTLCLVIIKIIGCGLGVPWFVLTSLSEEMIGPSP